ncbi:MAG: DUF2177 family protein [Pseudomonadota bacterium]
MKLITAYLIFALIFAVIDVIWIGTVAYNFYKEQLGDLMADPIVLPAAMAFYLLYVLGALIFVVSPALKLETGGVSYALLYGALFGFFCYMTYDLTNLAVTKNFPATMAYVDMAWGTTVTAVCSAATVLIVNRIYES